MSGVRGLWTELVRVCLKSEVLRSVSARILRFSL